MIESLTDIILEKETKNGFSGKIRDFYFPRYVQDHLKIKITIGRVLLTLVLLAGGALAYYLVPSPKAKPLQQANQTLKLDQNLAVEFSRPVKRNEVSLSIQPPIEGKWRWENAALGKHMFTRLVFEPKNVYRPDTEYTIAIKNVARVTGGSARDYSFKFRTQKVPGILSVDPKDGTQAVQPDRGIKVTLDEPNPNLARFAFEFDPVVEFSTIYDDAKAEYTIKPKAALEQGKSYRIKVSRSILLKDAMSGEVLKEDLPETLSQTNFKVATAPGLVSFSPLGSQVPVTTKYATFTFSQPMDRQSVEANFQASPTDGGRLAWVNDRVLNYYFSGDLNSGTNYRFVVKKGTRNANGGFLTADSANYFTTIGNAYVYATSPTNGSRGVGVNTAISFTFDQAVDHASAEGLFSISNGVSGMFSWSGNTLRFQPSKALARDTRYAAKVGAGVKSSAGFPSVREFNTTFTTETTVVKLNIPLDYQDYPLSCEVASLKMALGYKGIRVSENTLMSLVGYDPTPHVGNVWGDPDIAFVGSLNGRQNTTGYGVHWDPIARAANNYRTAKAFRGWTASQLAQELANGNPVVMWGVYPGGYYNPWYTKTGKLVPAWKGEHVRTIIGFTGPVSAPTQFIVNDPITGQSYRPISSFMADWKTYGYSGVVVY